MPVYNAARETLTTGAHMPDTLDVSLQARTVFQIRRNLLTLDVDLLPLPWTRRSLLITCVCRI